MRKLGFLTVSLEKFGRRNKKLVGMKRFKGFNVFYIVPLMLGMAVALTFLPNASLSQIGEYWVIATVIFSFVVSAFILKSWVDTQKQQVVIPPYQNSGVELCTNCGKNPAMVGDDYCYECNTKTIKVENL